MNRAFMQLSIELALEGITHNEHGPFGAVIVKENNLIATGTNRVTTSLDPTAHAEICAIRNACNKLKTFSLKGCEIYTSCEPCPMCLGAIFWARLEKIYYGTTQADAAKAGFDDHQFYEEFKKDPTARKISMVQLMHADCMKLFTTWQSLDKKIPY